MKTALAKTIGLLGLVCSGLAACAPTAPPSNGTSEYIERVLPDAANIAFKIVAAKGHLSTVDMKVEQTDRLGNAKTSPIIISFVFPADADRFNTKTGNKYELLDLAKMEFLSADGVEAASQWCVGGEGATLTPTICGAEFQRAGAALLKKRLGSIK